MGPKTEGSRVARRDPYEVLSVTRDSSDLEIKAAYRKLALNEKLVCGFGETSRSACPFDLFEYGKTPIKDRIGVLKLVSRFTTLTASPSLSRSLDSLSPNPLRLCLSHPPKQSGIATTICQSPDSPSPPSRRLTVSLTVSRLSLTKPCGSASPTIAIAATISVAALASRALAADRRSLAVSRSPVGIAAPPVRPRRHRLCGLTASPVLSAVGPSPSPSSSRLPVATALPLLSASSGVGDCLELHSPDFRNSAAAAHDYSNLNRYHPDKNASNPEASELFKEVAYSYSVLSDPEKRRQYDSSGFEALESDSMDMEIDLSNLGTVNTMFAALFSKLGVPIKTTVSATVLEEAMNGTVTVRPLPLGTSVSGKVEKQGAHFFGVSINEQQALAGIVVRVTSAAQSKFKLLYFEQDVNGGYGLALQGTWEDSEKAGKVTSAGMYFLHFQVYRMDSTVNALSMAKDPEGSFFKKLEGLQPCEVSELNAGTHIFAVYGDNFFKPASYTIEALCAKSYEETTEKLKDIETQILRKRNELRQFETEYRQALARFQEVTNRYSQEKQSVKYGLCHGRRIFCKEYASWRNSLYDPLLSCYLSVIKGKLCPDLLAEEAFLNPDWKFMIFPFFLYMIMQNSGFSLSSWIHFIGGFESAVSFKQVDELLKERDSIHSSYTVSRTVTDASENGASSSGKITSEEFKATSPSEEGNSDGKDKSSKKKWYNLNLRGSDKKLG
ncbi:hypothetical protein Syun_022705 [Stephania yunnanensis]|uniref:J domain-containing protein n=1 Tax=Stephania yunnanensis TaxID=152371 RepID=A0AAP0I3C3_9MAGN